MGGSVSTKSANHVEVFVAGLDNSGKTAVMNSLNSLSVRTYGHMPVGPTMGVERVQLTRDDGLKVVFTSCGGQRHMRPLWKHHFSSADAIVRRALLRHAVLCCWWSRVLCGVRALECVRAAIPSHSRLRFLRSPQIFVVDSADRPRLEEAGIELNRILLTESLGRCPILVCVFAPVLRSTNASLHR